MEKKQLGESKFWQFINFAGNAIGLNLMFMIVCLPVVTIGPAMCGLYSGVRYMIREDGWFRGFWAGFRTHFVRTCIAGLASVAAMAYMLINFNTAFNFFLDNGSMVPMITYGVMAVLPAMIIASLWPLNIYIPYGTADWLRNTVSLVFKAPLPVLATAGLMIVPVILVLYFTTLAFYSSIVIIAVYFAVVAFISTLLYKDDLVRLLTQYRSEHPREEEEAE